MSQEDLDAGVTNPDEDLDLDHDLEDSEDVEALREELERTRTAKNQILARAKKAEAEAKALKSAKPADAPQTINKTNTLTSEEIEVKILKAQKIPEDEIAYLKKLAAFNGTSLIEAQEDGMFVSFKAQKETAERSERSKLGASRGSSAAKKEKSFNSPGLTEADHKEMWRQSLER